MEGLERLPSSPCVVIANHASYIDAVVAVAALPPDFAFVIKKEMVKVPLAGLLLRRVGSEFVERFNRHEGASDVRRVLKLAASGQSLVFFPEGTFNGTRAIGQFLGGAFTTAQRSDMPVVAVALTQAREFGFEVVSCSSTGNLANAVAAQAARAGFRACIFMHGQCARHRQRAVRRGLAL